MSLTDFIKPPAHKRSLCLIKKIFLEVKEECLLLREGPRCVLLFIFYLKMADGTVLQSKCSLLLPTEAFTHDDTFDPEQVRYVKT